MELSGKLSKNRALSGSILRSTGGGGAVNSVNGQTGDVVLDAQDVGALPDSTVIPSKTSDLTNDSGFVNASGAAAAAPVQSVNGQTGAVTVSGLSQEAKTALMDCFAHTAWAVNNGQTYYDALASALGLRVLASITAVFTQGSAVIYDTDSLDTLKQYLVVTANYSDSTTATVTDYTLSGTLTAGTSTITVSYGGKTATFDVTVTFNETPGPNLADFESRLYVPHTSKITTSIDSNNNIICVCNNSPSYATINFYDDTPYLSSILENGKRYKIHFSFATTVGSGSHVVPSLRKSDNTAALSALELGVEWTANSGTFDGIWTQTSDVCKLNIFLSDDTASRNSYTVVISDLWIKEVVSSET